MRKVNKILLLILLISVFQIDVIAQKLTPDGPYILEVGDGYRYITVDKKGNIIDEILNSKPKNITVLSDDAKYSFKVHLSKDKFKRIPAKIDSPKKNLVLGDPHGDFESLYLTLLNNKVIDKKFNWTFGKNHLMVLGDIFDRGDDCTTILWLMYKLEQEAREKGGMVNYMIGNHEDMVLKGDNRYINDKYIRLADTLKIEHKNLYAKNTEFGKWIRTKNLIQIVGDNVFLHAGLSEDFMKADLDLDFVNSTVDNWLGMDKKSLAKQGGDTEMIYRTYGLLWYRGMVSDNVKYKPITPELTDKILKMYNVNKVIVGHTIFDDITLKQDGKVVTVNIRPEKNRLAKRGMGILIKEDDFYVIYADKLPVKMD